MRYDTEQATAKVRSVEESLCHATDAAGRLESILDGLLVDLTGSDNAADPCNAALPPDGVVYRADRLASRLEALTSLAQNVRDRVVTPRAVPSRAMSAAASMKAAFSSADATYG